jgi:hypothetical protein
MVRALGERRCKPGDGFASVDVGGHIYDLEEAGREVVAPLDQIDPNLRESLSVVDPQLG